MTDAAKCKVLMIVTAVQFCVIISMIMGMVTVAAGGSPVLGVTTAISTLFVATTTTFAILTYARS